MADSKVVMKDGVMVEMKAWRMVVQMVEGKVDWKVEQLDELAA